MTRASSDHSPWEQVPRPIPVPASARATSTGSKSSVSLSHSVSPSAASPTDQVQSQPQQQQQPQHAPPTPQQLVQPPRHRKVSRACDFCKSRKSRCSGTHPCLQCAARGQSCFFNAKYTRGRPRTPPRATPSSAETASDLIAHGSPMNPVSSQTPAAAAVAATPGLYHHHTQPLGHAQAQAQTQSPPQSSVWSSLSRPDNELTPQQPTSAFAGDRPLPELDHVKLDEFLLGDPHENRVLMALYFDVCIATYRVLHRPSTEHWLEMLERNVEAKRPIWQDLGPGRAAIILVILAIATLHSEKSKGQLSSTGDDESRALRRSDELFSISSWLLSRAEGIESCPATLETAQASILQVLYLLQTSRFNRAWYVFGNSVPVIWMIGLHRRESPKRMQVSKLDYIQQQCRQRTFWTAYTLDNYLRIVFGRPRHFHDEDVDQQFPDRINDADMTATLSGDFVQVRPESDVDGLIFHAKISQIIGAISRHVYTIRKISEEDRAVAAYRQTLRVKEWRDSLPPHLGSVSPSLLLPRYRRQAVILKLAYHHAIMHASRPFLLQGSCSPDSATSVHVRECLAAAHGALEIANGMACEGPMFNAFWWTHYVVYCALVVVYMFEIQQRRQQAMQGTTTTGIGASETMPTANTPRSDLDLAERCRVHLSRATATNSPSRRYGVILEELRAATTSEQGQVFDRPGHMGLGHLAGPETDRDDTVMDDTTALPPSFVEAANPSVWTDPRLWDSWETTDWLELDSSAFRYPSNVDDFMLWS